MAIENYTEKIDEKTFFFNLSIDFGIHTIFIVNYLFFVLTKISNIYKFFYFFNKRSEPVISKKYLQENRQLKIISVDT